MKNTYLIVVIIFVALVGCSDSENSNVPGPPKEGLVGYYKFTDGSALDLSGENNHGLVSRTILGEDRFGNTNEAFTFNSDDDFIKVSNPSFVTNNQGAFSAWVKLSNFSHTQYLASVGDEASIESYMSFIRVDPANKTIGIYQREVGLANWVEGSTILEPNIYYHIVMQSDGTEWSIYINGQKETLSIKSGANSGKWVGDLTGIDNFVIGSSIILPPHTIPYLSGTLDEVLIYDRPLTEKEIDFILNLKK